LPTFDPCVLPLTVLTGTTVVGIALWIDTGIPAFDHILGTVGPALSLDTDLILRALRPAILLQTVTAGPAEIMIALRIDAALIAFDIAPLTAGNTGAVLTNLSGRTGCSQTGINITLTAEVTANESSWADD